MRPEDFKYTKTHEWVKINDKKKEALIGITDYAVEQLSDLVHLELPKAGTTVEQESAFGEVESVKTVADLVSPLSGKVLESNARATNDPEIVKEEPYEEGWLIRIKFTQPSEFESLMDKKEYEAFLESDAEKEDEEKESEEKDEAEEDNS